jgi:hypothetical protein
MRIKSFALALALCVASAAMAPVAAQDAAAAARGNWAAVQALTPGEKLVIKTKEGARKSVRFDSATDLLLVVTKDNRKVTYVRDDLRLVQLNRGKSRSKSVALGAAIGGGGGAAVGGGIYASADGDFIGAVVPIVALMGAGLGAGIGALFTKGNKNVTIYEAP